MTAFDTKQTITLVPICYFPQFPLSDVPNWFYSNHCNVLFLSTSCTLKTNLTALCTTLCLIEAERINVAISATPHYQPSCGMSWVPSSLSALHKMWNQSWTLSQEWFWLCHAQGSYSPSAPARCFLWCSPSVCSTLWLVLSWHFTCSLPGWGHVSYSLMQLLHHTMLIEWAIWQHTGGVPWASLLLREKKDTASGTQQSGENLDVVGL